MRRISVRERCVVELIRSMFISAPDNWIQVTHGVYGSMLQALGTCIGLLGAVPCCPCPNPFRNVQQGSVGLVSRFGQFYKSVDPGLVQVNVCTESLRVVDVKIQISPIGRQKVITRDNVDVEM